MARVEQLTGGGDQVAMTGTEVAENSRLGEEREALAMLEASLRSLRKTMSEIDRGGNQAPVHVADLDQFRSTASLPAPRPRWRRGLWSL